MNVLCFRGAVRHTCLDRPTRLRRRDLIYVPLGLPTVAHGIVGKRERRLVRKRGFEPLRYCYRQPLKTIRLGQMANKSFSERGCFRSEMPSERQTALLDALSAYLSRRAIGSRSSRTRETADRETEPRGFEARRERTGLGP